MQSSVPKKIEFEVFGFLNYSDSVVCVIAEPEGFELPVLKGEKVQIFSDSDGPPFLLTFNNSEGNVFISVFAAKSGVRFVKNGVELFSNLW